jgi:FkbM family methyltransferase
MSDIKLNYFFNKYYQEIKNVAQVGAHFGQEIEIFDKYNINQIFLFEPNQNAVEVLKNKTKNLPKIKIFPFALGNENSLSKMYHSSGNEGQSSSLLEPKVHKKVQPEIEFKEKVTIEVKRFEDLKINDIDFLIMDVQGFELEVLKGFGKKLNQVQFIFTEINRDELYKDNVLVKDLDYFLKNKGFIRTWTSWRTADMPWGDAFYLRISRLGKFKKSLIMIKNLLTINKVYFFLYFIFDFRLLKKRIRTLISLS